MNGAKSERPDCAPYAAPASEQPRKFAAPATTSASAPGYREQSLTAWIACGMFVFQALLQSAVAVWGLLSTFGWFPATRTPLAGSIVLVSIKSYPLLFFAGLAPFVLFLVNANRNARAFLVEERAEEENANLDEAVDSQEAEYSDDDDDDEIDGVPVTRPRLFQFSPASMAWWFFVPIFSFFRPLQAVKAVWFASTPKGKTYEPKGTTLLWAWWLVWLASWLGPTLFNLMPRSRQSWLNDSEREIGLAACEVLRIAACLFAVQMVRSLHARQRARAAELWTAS